MMKSLISMMSISLFLIGVLGAYSSEAQTRRARQQSAASSEPSGSSLYSGSYLHEVSASMTRAEIESADGNTSLSASGSYKYMFSKAMQVGGLAEFSVVNVNGSSLTTINLWGSFTYNFNQTWDVSDSYYATVALGLAQAPGSDERSFSYMALGGKRFPLFQQVLYTPEAGFRKLGNADMSLYLMPINVSVVF